MGKSGLQIFMIFQHCASKDMESRVQVKFPKVVISKMLFSCTGISGMGELEGMGEQGVARIRLVGMGAGTGRIRLAGTGIMS